MALYACRVCGEDLTTAVAAARDEEEVVTYRLLRIPRARPAGEQQRPWRVTVTCSKDHKNVFAGTV